MFWKKRKKNPEEELISYVREDGTLYWKPEEFFQNKKVKAQIERLKNSRMIREVREKGYYEIKD